MKRHLTFAVAIAFGIGLGPDLHLGALREVEAAEPAVNEPEASIADLPRIPPTEPAATIAKFKIREGFKIELAAAEPLVMDPVAMCFDADGRMYVAEMRDYSERRDERLGRITWLEDADGDGTYERGGVFADRIPWPTAILCYGGGILVGTTPDILFLKDTNADGRADQHELLYTGFAAASLKKLNVQALLNSFHWGIDHRIHGSASVSGGTITSPLRAEDPALELRGRDFSFDPNQLDIRSESGGGQHGMSFDRWGRKFLSSNSDHLQAVMYDVGYRQDDSGGDWPSPNLNIAVDGASAPVFRISPDEPWRVLRTRWRVAGTVEGMIEGGGRPSGYFTGATGVTIYEGDAFPEEYRGDVFVADCGSNLVHHKKLRRSSTALQPAGERPPDESNREFLASPDNWFRPVQFVNGPDGALYILDMYREVIEHPWSLPPGIKKHLDLNSGNDRGRIYRVVPDAFRRRSTPQLSKATAAELIDLLGHRNAWHRESASRLLFERQDFENAKKAVPAAARTSTNSMARLHAFYLWEAFGKDASEPLTPELLIAGLKDSAPEVRTHALRILETLCIPAQGRVPDVLVGALRELSRDPQLEVRYQLAWTLSKLNVPGKLDLWINLIETGLADPWLRMAVLNSIRNDSAPVMERLAQKTDESANTLPVQEEISKRIGKRNKQEELNLLSTLLEKRQDEAELVRLVAALAGGLESAGASWADQTQLISQTRIPKAAEKLLPQASDTALTANARAAIRVLLDSKGTEWRTKLWEIALNGASPEIQKGIMDALMRKAQSSDFDQALANWPKLATASKESLQTVMLRKPDGLVAWLKGVERGIISRQGISIGDLASLRKHSDDSIRKVVHQLFGPGSTENRQAVVDKHLNAVALPGNADKGLEIYRQRCVICHRLKGQGQMLGPDLESVQSTGKEKLLVNILDPNREVQPQYQSYLVITQDGEEREGLLVSDTGTQVTLRQAGGMETTWKRNEIRSIQSSGKSLMPEGLEEGLDDSMLADLLTLLSGGK